MNIVYIYAVNSCVDMNKHRLPIFLTTLATALLAACNNSSTPAGRSGANDQAAPVVSEKVSFLIDTIQTDLDNPWGITWLPDGRMLVTERSGQILIFNDDQYSNDNVVGFPQSYQRGQGGLLDIKAHPHANQNGWIYATYAKPSAGGGSTALVRFQLSGNTIEKLEELYQTHPIHSARIQFGSRIIFDNDGYVYFSTGDRGVMESAQDLTNDQGKVLRLYDDGRIPTDNPFVNTPGAMPAIWSYGHRNIQGMAYDPEQDMIYATEHGPRGGDELNIIEKGRNYGWPVITYGIAYDGAIISDLTEKEGMEQPIHYWVPSIATCGLLFYTDSLYAGWERNLFAGGLAGMHIARIEVAGDRYRRGEKLLQDIGRVRQVAQSPDGYIYVLTEGPGMLLKLMPMPNQATQ